MPDGAARAKQRGSSPGQVCPRSHVWPIPVGHGRGADPCRLDSQPPVSAGFQLGSATERQEEGRSQGTSPLSLCLRGPYRQGLGLLHGSRPHQIGLLCMTMTPRLWQHHLLLLCLRPGGGISFLGWLTSGLFGSSAFIIWLTNCLE